MKAISKFKSCKELSNYGIIISKILICQAPSIIQIPLSQNFSNNISTILLTMKTFSEENELQYSGLNCLGLIVEKLKSAENDKDQIFDLCFLNKF